MSGLFFDCRLSYPAGFSLELAFEAGDGVTALFGPSGSGKSTTLGLIAGLQRPDAGNIRLGARVLIDTSRGVCLPPERRGLGLVFQDHLLFPHLSVRDNLLFGHGRGSSRPVDLDRVVKVLEIGELLPRSPETLSGGQRQRVALGRALLRGPELLLLDEPLAALDEALKDRILTYLERVVNEFRLPTLLVSHDQEDVRRLAERVVIIDKGRLVASGSTATTLDHVLMTRPGMTQGPINLLRVAEVRPAGSHREGRIDGQILHLPAGESSGDVVYVRFLPSEVILAREPIGGLSARNHLQGVIREILLLPDRAYVAVDVGQFLWAHIMPEAVRELGLETGQRVTCLIKTSSMVVVS